MKDKKTVCRQVPCPLYDVESCESWLAYMAGKGLFLERWGRYTAVFRPGPPQAVRYRLTAARLKGFILFSAPSAPDVAEEELYAASGWEFVCAREEFFFYCCKDPHAPELHTDPAVQAISLKMAVRSAIYVFAIVIFNYVLFWGRNFSAISFRIVVELPLVSLLFVLFFLSVLIFYWMDLYSVLRLRHRLRKGIPPNHRKNWKTTAGLYRVLGNMLRGLGPLLIVLLLAIWIIPHPSPALSSYHEPLPFATLSDIAEGTVIHSEDIGRNTIDKRQSLLAPLILEYYEYGQIVQNDNVVLNTSLQVNYYETVCPWLTRRLVDDLHHQRVPLADLPQTLPVLPGVDAAWGYANKNGAFQELILLQGSRVVQLVWNDTDGNWTCARLALRMAEAFTQN